ncbi:MAG: HPr(Ser) kinase/phosphatase [Oscillospiraceae bacterium]|jgi:HPr kinase/phosphorylase|nr:HPr(Ser) kinase/phosphatase [Oscillospiraceae bacterium]
MEEIISARLSHVAETLMLDVIFPSKDYERVRLTIGDVYRPGLQLAGFYDYFDARRIMLLGKMEMSYLETLDEGERARRLETLFEQKFPALVACHEIEIPEIMFELADRYDITILGSSMNTSAVMSNLIRVLQRELAPSITRHGVLVDIYSVGVLIMGESGVGKSETALELLKRGHRLIADDAVEIKVTDVNVLQGSSPALIRHYMELRGVGVIDIRQIFGAGAIKNSQNIHLVVNLENWVEDHDYDRLGLSEETVNILGVNVASVRIPVRSGRNLAVILEVAAMNQKQKFAGHNAALELTNQINAHFDARLKGDY